MFVWLHSGFIRWGRVGTVPLLGLTLFAPLLELHTVLVMPTSNTQHPLTPSSKPYLAKPILSDQGTSSALAGKVLISICAGIRVSQLASWVPESVTVVRAMPNTPCKVCWVLHSTSSTNNHPTSLRLTASVPLAPAHLQPPSSSSFRRIVNHQKLIPGPRRHDRPHPHLRLYHLLSPQRHLLCRRPRSLARGETL